MEKNKKKRKPKPDTAATYQKCPICGEMAFGWVYMLHFTLGCETAKNYN